MMEIMAELEGKIRLAKTQGLKSALTGYEVARSALYFYESLSLPLIELLATGKRAITREELKRRTKTLTTEVYQLLERDAELIAQGVYPASVLAPESPIRHISRLPKIWLDGFFLARRKKQNKTKEFSPEAAEYFRDVPDYYRRNFHYQTGGYFSQESAEIYDHQVEMLFAGTADAMRRLLLTPLRAHFPYSQGEGLRFLEIGPGTGRFSRFLRITFPKAKITVMDLSYPYLKKARLNLKDFDRIDYVQGDGAHIPFQEGQFDAVLSCFLFHELPLDIRKRVVAESYRVLKSQGFMGLVDSLQQDDTPSLNWALEQFPKDFHEPFYKNYVMNSMEGLLQYGGLLNVRNEKGFLSKAVYGMKSTDEGISKADA